MSCGTPGYLHAVLNLWFMVKSSIHELATVALHEAQWNTTLVTIPVAACQEAHIYIHSCVALFHDCLADVVPWHSDSLWIQHVAACEYQESTRQTKDMRMGWQWFSVFLVLQWQWRAKQTLHCIWNKSSTRMNISQWSINKGRLT